MPIRRLELSQSLDVSIDKLFGYSATGKPISIYEEEYKTTEYYWGTEPNAACYQVLEMIPPTRRVKLDIGCGKGRMPCFARNGYDVTAFDISDAGIEKTKLADHIGVHVNVFKADISDYRLIRSLTCCIPAAFCIISDPSIVKRFC